MADPTNPGTTPGMPPLRSDNMPPLRNEKVASDPKAKRKQSTPHENLGPSAQQKSKASGSKIHNITNNDTDQKDIQDTPDPPDQSRPPQIHDGTTRDPTPDNGSEGVTPTGF